MGPGSALAARSLVQDDGVLLFAGGTGGKGGRGNSFVLSLQTMSLML